MGRVFEPARVKSGVPRVQRLPYADSLTFKRGAVMIKGTGGLITEGATDAVAAIVGIALQPVDTGPGYGVADSSSVLVTTGRTQETSIALADAETVFAGRMVNGATDPVTPANSDRFAQYALLKQASGEWVIDQTDTTNVAVEIVDFDADKKEVYFRFLPSVLETGF